MPCLQEKVLIVAGAAGGLGRAHAEALGAQGAHLVLADIGCEADGTGSDATSLETLAAGLRDSGVEVASTPLDLRAPDSTEQLVALARERFGRVDGGVFCAGVQRPAGLLRSSDAELEQLFAIQLLAPLRFCRDLGAALVQARQGGSMLVCAGTAGCFGAPRQFGHSVSEAALAGMVRAAAADLRQHSVRMNAIAPLARTRQTAHLPLFAASRQDSLTPEHVAAVSSFLMADASRDVSGELLGVAGGRIYGLRVRETPGAYLDGPPATPEALQQAWDAVLSG